MNNIIINKTSNEKVVAEKRATRLKKTILISTLSFGMMFGLMDSGFCMKRRYSDKGSISSEGSILSVQGQSKRQKKEQETKEQEKKEQVSSELGPNMLSVMFPLLKAESDTLCKDNELTNEYLEAYPKLKETIPGFKEAEESVINKLTALNYETNASMIAYIIKKDFLNLVKELDGFKLTNDSVKCLIHLPNLKDLTINEIEGAYREPNVLNVVFKLDLTSLCLKELGIIDKEVEELGKVSNGQLQKLNLDWCNVTKVSGGLDKLQELTHLSLYHNKLDTLKGIEKLTRLEILDISDNKIGPGQCIFISQLPNLISLDISLNPIGDEGMKAIAGLLQLKKLDVGVCELTNASLESIAKLTKLTSLNMCANANMTDAAVSQISVLSELVDLNVAECSFGDQAAVVFARFPKIESINFGSNNVGDKGAFALATSLTLTSLNIAGDNKVTIEGSEELYKYLRNLYTNLPEHRKGDVRMGNVSYDVPSSEYSEDEGE